jgi:hypothetical protein
MKNLPKIQVIELTARASTSNVINSALLIKTTGDPLAGSPPVTDVVLHGKANSLQTIYLGSKASPPTYTSGEVTTQQNIVITAYNKIVDYIKGVANDAAIDAGDVTAGMDVVTRCGVKLRKKGVRATKSFSAVSKTPGSIDITSKAVAPRAGYIRQYGITTAKGIVPTVLSDNLYSLEVDVHIDNLESGKIYGFREASILPVSRKKKASSTITEAAKAATQTHTNKAHKVTFSDGAAHYIYSDWIYIVIQ